MPSIEWVKPLPLWADVSTEVQSGVFKRPFLVEYNRDDFMETFLNLVEGQLPDQTPADLSQQAPALTAGRAKLYLPAHQRYYLVIGSLVCRQLSLPDRAVAVQNGEAAAFVIRRLVDDGKTEQAWVDSGPNRGWHDVTGDGKNLYPGEERLPLHPVTVQEPVQPSGTSLAFSDAFKVTTFGRRLFYGYIPTGNRAKYIEQSVSPTTDPETEMQSYVETVLDQDSNQQDPRLDEIDERVIGPWRNLFESDGNNLPGENLPVVSLYLLLDLADFLKNNLPTVFAALGTSGGSLSGDRLALFQAIENIDVTVTRAGGATNNNLSLEAALKELVDAGKLSLVRGVGEEPADAYDLKIAKRPDGLAMGTANGSYLNSPAAPGAAGGPFFELFKAALAEEKQERQNNDQPWVSVTEESISLLRNQVKSEPAAGDVYCLRLVYDYPPCRPVVSVRSVKFIIAKFFEPDAPARPIRIELPSIKMKDLRKFQRGVGLEMAPELRDLMNRVHKGLLDDEGLKGASVSWELGMICTFSLQIIFLVAFIVMFIFLIALNFIFWWLPFLKICFPIPKKT